MPKEKVKYIDGSEVEVEIYRLGFRKALAITKKHIPINDLTFLKDGGITIKGDVDMMGLIESSLETIVGLDLDKLEGEEAQRLWKKYFEKDVMAGMGQGGNPN